MIKTQIPLKYEGLFNSYGKDLSVKLNTQDFLKLRHNLLT